MTIFQELRLWARRAPIGERLSSVVGAALVLAVLGWLLVPTSSQNRSVSVGAGVASGSGAAAASSAAQVSAQAGQAAAAAQNAAAGAGGSGGSAGSGAAGAAGQATAGGAPGATSATSGRCVSPPGSDQGITSTQINLAIILINLVGPSTNQATGVPTVQQQQQNFDQVIGAVNGSGGAACRKIVARYYSPNIADQSQVQQTCIQIVQSKPFAVIDSGSFSFFPALASCLPQAQLPTFSGLALPQSQQTQFYPYWFALEGIAETLYHNAVFALKQSGFFDPAKGFTKLGILYRDCEPQYYPEVVNWLHQVGVTSSQMVPYDTGCPATAVAPPNDNEAAILKFQQNQVSNVMFVDGTSNFVTWSQIAGQQGFHPKYGFPDDGEVAISSAQSGSQDWNNLNGAIAILNGRYGEPTTPGMSPTPGTAACNAIYAKYGQPPVWQRQDDGLGGVACDDIWVFAAAVDHAPVLQRNALAAGLQASRSLDFSYPQGPAVFTGYHATGGGEYWRAIQANSSCSCWRVIDQTFHPSF